MNATAVAPAHFSSAHSVLQTGDLVLFAGDSPFSVAIEAATGCRWTHVGMVVKTPKPPQVLLWESLPSSNIADVQSGKNQWGVQLVPLKPRLDPHSRELAVRRLEWPRAPAALGRL